MSLNLMNNTNVPTKIAELYDVMNEHKIWDNPLLLAIQQGKLSFKDFQILFSQYYFYCKNFTRLLAALMVNCDNDLHRSKLSCNLWEEGGGADINERHAEIFRRFLTEHLKVGALEDIVFEPYTQQFFRSYMNICLYSSPVEIASALSFGTESIVPRLYTIFRDGLKNAGLSNEAVYFFDLHIEHDDEHAQTIEEIVLSYSHSPDWFLKCKESMVRALDERDLFFNNIYLKLSSNHDLDYLVNRAAKPSWIQPTLPERLVFNVDFSGNVLYKNDAQKDQGIFFKVERLPFAADILDPRLVCIPAGYTNELHSHAHETVFLILEGEGHVKIQDSLSPVRAGDIVFVPRWLSHQTQNTGKVDLKFFAVTDYGFTKCFSQNSETAYRKIKAYGDVNA